MGDGIKAMYEDMEREADAAALVARNKAITRFMQRNAHETYDALSYMQIDVDSLIKANLSLTKDQHRRLDKISHTLEKLLK